ncbi:hypothetical protein EDF68_11424 [Ochrobactrum sp. BH3]|nr:hypothetical protein EDF68_11424 [Ochrobactrum sp. BH3]
MPFPKFSLFVAQDASFQSEEAKSDILLTLLQAINRYTSTNQVDEFLKLLHGPLSQSSGNLSDRDVHRLHVMAASRRAELNERSRAMTLLQTCFPKRDKSQQSRNQAAEGKREPQRWARKRRLGGLSAMPPSAAVCGFTEGERATLYIVAADVRQTGACRCTVAEIADRAGVGSTTARNAIRKARLRGLLKVSHRPQGRCKWLSNIITIVCLTWLGWLKRFRPNLGLRAKFKGVKKATTIDTNGRSKGNRAPNLEATLLMRRQIAFEGSVVSNRGGNCPV